MSFSSLPLRTNLTKATAGRPDRETSLEVHADEIARYGDRSGLVERIKRDTFFTPVDLDCYFGTYWLNLSDPDGLPSLRTAITPGEAGRPQ